MRDNIYCISYNNVTFDGKCVGLTHEDEVLLSELVSKDKLQLDEQFSASCKTVVEIMEVTSSHIGIQYCCASCSLVLLVVEKHLLSLLSGRWKLKGLTCGNVECKLYCKLIPISRVDALAKRFSTPIIEVATENYLKEHPECRRQKRST